MIHEEKKQNSIRFRRGQEGVERAIVEGKEGVERAIVEGKEGVEGAKKVQKGSKEYLGPRSTPQGSK